MNLMKIITAIFSALLLMIGVDKFFPFLTPPCTLMSDISPIVWKAIGAIQLIAAVLVWKIKFRKNIAWLFLGLMIYFTIRHIMNGTYDIGGAVFLAILCILIIWDPSFLNNKK